MVSLIPPTMQHLLPATVRRNDSVRRSARITSLRATTSKLASANHGHIELKGNLVYENLECKLSSTAQPHFSEDDKTPPEQFQRTNLPHSAVCNVSMPPNGGIEAPTPTYKFKHSTRTSNTYEDFERDQRPRLLLPQPNDKKAWAELDGVLHDALHIVFNKNLFSTYGSTTELSTKFDNWLYEFLRGRCGIQEPTTSNPPPLPNRKHRGLERLRQQKNECRASFKALKKAGLQESDTAKLCKRYWLKLIRSHNRLRWAVQARKRQWAKVNAERQFKKNPVDFSKKLFSGQRKNGVPSFDKETGQTYFKEMYRDEERSHDFTPLEGMKRPPPPNHAFFEKPPTFKELKRSVRSKRNGAAAGLNALTYVLYKRCNSVLRTLYNILLHVFDKKDVPADWAAAFVVLLQKSDDLSKPEEFRPIAITNTVGKIFFSIISDRLQKFMVKNRYINSGIQKGFLFGVPGCIEHSFALHEALSKASTEKRAIVISWIDLANAYGSVRHNLIQFALNWYHVPESIQHLIFDYYEKLCAKVTTKAWSTGFFGFDIGLFQGCVLSTILFDCVFNLLLDFLSVLEEKNKFIIQKSLNISSFTKAYADDLCITTRTPAGHQRALDRTNVWLDWTITMKAKPKKCVSLAFRQFRRGAESTRGFVPVKSTIYSPYDPKLSIAGKPINFILQPAESGNEFKASHFKFLGRWFSVHLHEEDVKKKFKKEFFECMEIVNRAPVNGFMKIWIYQHFVLGMVSWPLFVQDFCRSFVQAEISSPTGVYLKKWAGLFHSAEVGTLYRQRTNLGLGLTSPILLFEKLQVIRCHLLANSPDVHISTLYKLRKDKEQEETGRVFRSTRLASESESMVSHQLQFQAAEPGDRRGLGHGLYQANPSLPERRVLCTKAVTKLNEESFSTHAVSLARQGCWTKWWEKTSSFDFSWNNMIYGPGPRVLSFVLNAYINSLPTPDMLSLMYTKVSDLCKLCNQRGTLHHILVNCDKALIDKRYTWRHDSVLATLLQAIQPVLLAHNEDPPQPAPPPSISYSFVKSGTKTFTKRPSPPRPSLLGTASDWKLLIDFDKKKIVFPSHIYGTDERPDIVLWSDSLREVIIVELTCPAEEGIEAAAIRKKARYLPLKEAINASKTKYPWTARVLTIEAGARGFVANSMHAFLKKIGFTSSQARKVCKYVSEVTARCSYGIWLSRSIPTWNSSRQLVVPNSEDFVSPPPLTIRPELSYRS